MARKKTTNGSKTANGKKNGNGTKAAKAAGASTPVDAIKHKSDKRSNIPTRELASFAADDEMRPKKLLYPRDPSLDPQLVWKGKDEQDQKPLEVPAVPIYIQEKVHPQAIIEDLRTRAAEGRPDPAPLFADFNGLDDDFAKKVDFYQHEQHWTNRMILGDSLLVMASLAEKERLKGRVQMIYMDPPYGIKFGSNWQVSTRKRDVKDSKAEDVTRQPEQIRAFRDTWRLGIHTYLAYLRDRLTVAHELLNENGSVFVQIGDENVHLVRCVLEEVFGSENFISLITVRKTGGTTGAFLPSTADYVLWFVKDIERSKFRPMFRLKASDDSGLAAYDFVELPNGSRRRLTDEDRALSTLPGKRLQFTVLTSQRIREARTGFYAVNFEGGEYWPTRGEWTTHREGMAALISAGRVARSGNTLRYVRYLDDFPATELANTWTDLGGASEPVYVVQTNAEIVRRCLLMTTDVGDLVLDPTCGSGTTAYVAEQWGRRWITNDTSRVALALARTRLMAAKFPYYLLADSPAGRKKEAELAGVPTAADAPPAQNDIRRGFVYKKVPHVTLKSIANNPDIKEGMTREQIDAAIKKHAETETLFDQPYEDKSVVRVAGPYTVESLSPHRMLPTGEGEAPAAEVPKQAPAPAAADFVGTILDYLRKAGVQNTVKQERLTFDRLDRFPGENIHAEGTFTEAGKTKTVKLCIGPEFGTVGPELLKDAAKEAMRGPGCDLLLVCGFAFDPHVSEEAKKYGKLKVLTPRMNPDLTMGDELLKKTGAGNLFLIFGEPDIRLDRQKDGKLTVEILGVDVYDPTTGEVRSHTTDDIACWFIDTDYNGESFFVRHAYFCGGDQPYEKLQRALRAEINEAEWAKLYSTKSVPFVTPKKGQIAVKVINHYGDEVLKVYKTRDVAAP
jgi:adenine-specific DNA-methyltransferase